MTTQTATNTRRTLSASTLIGDPVNNTDGEKLGDLKELMLDINTGRIAYGVLDFGGLMGMGNKLFAIPFDRFQVDEQNHKLILNVPKETLKNAEGFDKYNWPDMADPKWEKRIHDYYDATTYHQRR